MPYDARLPGPWQTSTCNAAFAALGKRFPLQDSPELAPDAVAVLESLLTDPGEIALDTLYRLGGDPAIERLVLERVLLLIEQHGLKLAPPPAPDPLT